MTMFEAFVDEMEKLARINSVQSQQRSERANQGTVTSGGIHRGDMYGESPLLPQREPSPVKPLEKKKGNLHPKSN
jgi:hypothetical protein